MGVAAGNLWLVWLATFILQPMEHTNHNFPLQWPRAFHVTTVDKLQQIHCSVDRYQEHGQDDGYVQE